MPDLIVQFDNDSAPWHTTCTVTGHDRPGTLAALAAAFAAAGVVVHSARVARVDGELVDRFALSDRLGRKLDDGGDGARPRRARRAHRARRSRLSLRR